MRSKQIRGDGRTCYSDASAVRTVGTRPTSGPTFLLKTASIVGCRWDPGAPFASKSGGRTLQEDCFKTPGINRLVLRSRPGAKARPAVNRGTSPAAGANDRATNAEVRDASQAPD